MAECAQTLLYLTLNNAKLQKSEIKKASRGVLVCFKYIFISMLGYKSICVLYNTYHMYIYKIILCYYILNTYTHIYLTVQGIFLASLKWH